MTAPLDRFSSSSFASTELPSEPAASSSPAPTRSLASSAAPSPHELAAWTGVPDDSVCPMPSGVASAQTAASTRPAPARADVEAFAVLDAPLAKLAREFPDGDATDFRARHWDGFHKASTDPRLNEALGRLTRAEASDVLGVKVRERWPTLSKEDAATLTADLADSIGHGLRQRAAYTLRDTAVRMLREGAGAFEATAKDPRALCDAAHQLALLEGPGSSAEARAHAAQLRGALGVASEPPQVTPEALAAALTARATLMRAEAWSLEEAGESTVYRHLLRHDVRAVVAREAGLEPGSWAATQLDAAKVEGHRQEAQLKKAEQLSMLLLCVAPVGTGLALGSAAASAMATGTMAAIGSREALVAAHHVDGAAAGESAGTMGAGAHLSAQVEAKRAAAEWVATTALAAVASKGTHHAVEKLGRKLHAPITVDALAHAGIHDRAHAVVAATGQALVPQAQVPRAPGRHALERLASSEER